jgi:rhamnopyranosyl-N-acetylglucosaminyl-diphospho-decaprenol beta-1,3/1,4-galactofuranosyltransferase
MRIAAVIVTYNRLELLKRCVKAVLAQSRAPDEVLVVNNGSTDGTQEWLAQESGLIVITQKNLGSAGGFHTGFKHALDRGHDWVWCMDDDGVAAPDCLEQLLKPDDGHFDFRSPMVLSIEDPARLAFELLPKGATANITTKVEARETAIDGLLPGIATPFNGTLINRLLLLDVGLPLVDLFIWGDEVEFQLRAEKAGHGVGIVTSSEFYHPKNRLLHATFHFRGGTHGFPRHTGDALRDYVALRNSSYIEFRYRGFMWTLRRHFYCTIYHLVEFGPSEAWRAFCAGQAGIWGHLRGHRKYLKR